MDDRLPFVRKVLSFSGGEASLKKVFITERPLSGEDEDEFTQRLLAKYGKQQGTIEIVLKNERVDYAIVTLA